MDEQLRQAMLREAQRNASDHPADLDAAIRDGSRRLVRRLVIVESISILAAVLILSLVGTAAVAGSGRTDDINTAQLTGLAITPHATTLAVDGTVQLNARGSYSDGTSRRITSAVDWAIADPARATIDAHGFVTATRPGFTTVTATASGIHGSAQLTIKPDTKPAAHLTGLAITPHATTLAVDGTVQLNARGSYSDGTSRRITSAVDWAIADPARATIDAHGFVTATRPGFTTVTATASGIHGSAQLTIKPDTKPAAHLTGLAITPHATTLAVDGTVQLNARGSYSDGTSRRITSAVDWAIADPARATIDAHGFVTATRPGFTTVTATASGIHGSAQLTIITQRAPELTGITVTPSDSRVCYPETVQLTARGSYSDGTSQAITSPIDWSTDNANVATVDEHGFVTVTEEQGTAHITATDGQFSSSAAVTCSNLRQQPTPSGSTALGLARGNRRLSYRVS